MTEAKRKWHNIFQVLKEKSYKFTILHPGKTSFRKKRKSKFAGYRVSLEDQLDSHNVIVVIVVLSDSLRPH